MNYDMNLGYAIGGIIRELFDIYEEHRFYTFEQIRKVCDPKLAYHINAMLKDISSSELSRILYMYSKKSPTKTKLEMLLDPCPAIRAYAKDIK